MSKSNLWVILAFFILLAGAAYVIFQRQKAGSGSHILQTFAYADTASLDKIVVSDRGRSSHSLTRKLGKTNWLIDGKHEASPAKVKEILATLHDLKVKRPCTKAEREIVIKQMATTNLRVELFSGRELKHTYFLGAPTDEHQGNYALLADTEDPVVVNLASWQGYVSARLLIDPTEWRNKWLIRMKPYELRHVSINFPSRPADNFELNMPDANHFLLASKEPIDTTKTVTFLIGLGSIYAESYLPDVRLADSLARLTPGVKAIVKGEDPAKTVEIWIYLGDAKTSKDIKEQAHYFAYLPAQKQAITLQPQNVLPFFVRKSDLLRSAL